MTTILNKFMEVARKELGVSEKKNPERIREFNLATTLQALYVSTPWCSSFANFVVREAGCITTRSAAARSWLHWGQEIDDPIPGCIAVFKRTDDPKLGHVGFYNLTSGNLFNIIGGDQHESVCYANFLASSLISLRVPLGFNIDQIKN